MTIALASPTGPRTTFKIFGSPLSPANGMWAFGYTPDEGAHVWDKVPLDVDIVVTHGPPKYHCDERKERRSVGCEALRQTLWRVRPRLAICGHVHEGRGAERVTWDLAMSNIKYKEHRVERWEDPGLGNKRMSLVDLTSKGGKPLQNDGAAGPLNVANTALKTSQNLLPVPAPGTSESPSKDGHKMTTQTAISHVAPTLLALPMEPLPPPTRGQGGEPPSQRCDLEALTGRLGRKETCIINAAITASSWPRSVGGKKFNKPIVVDIDLPIWGT